MRKPSEFVLPTERCGWRRVGACHQSRRRRPPPPRLVGMKPALFGWPWATLLTGSSWAAIGAVRPSPTIVCTNERRETRPALTCSSSLRISCSSIGASATTKTRTRVLRCESLTRVADAGCSGAALMAHGGNLSLGRIFRTRGITKCAPHPMDGRQIWNTYMAFGWYRGRSTSEIYESILRGIEIWPDRLTEGLTGWEEYGDQDVLSVSLRFEILDGSPAALKACEDGTGTGRMSTAAALRSDDEISAAYDASRHFQAQGFFD